METLKRFAFIAVFSIICSGLIAQSQSAQQAAFAKSYESEQAGKYILAINDLKPVYKSDGYFVNIRMGWLYYLVKQYSESIKYYNIAISLKPYAIEARFGCIKPLSALESWENVKAQYFQILKIDPQNTLANYWLGVIYYNRKNYTTAEKLFEKVVNLYPLDYDSIVMLAWTKLNLGKSPDARILFYQALVIRPNDSSALSGLKQLK
ncbi:MAG: tetratricopeptide repeat protein [Paludibacter sp.]|nr:tetratricopeptide repeat protein [Paludibacter sp.]